MHGFGMGWHRSHHGRRRDGRRFEANDLYPVTFAVLTVVAMAIGASLEGLRVLVPVGVGVTAYGLSYAVVHELVIHRRVPVAARALDRAAEKVPRLGTAFDHVTDAHALHHRFGGAPYGMLVPVVPRDVRARATRSASTVEQRRSALRNELVATGS
jgi:beta-carotene 3-hydroxylase